MLTEDGLEKAFNSIKSEFNGDEVLALKFMDLFHQGITAIIYGKLMEKYLDVSKNHILSNDSINDDRSKSKYKISVDLKKKKLDLQITAPFILKDLSTDYKKGTLLLNISVKMEMVFGKYIKFYSLENPAN